jgi:anthraniloyl-CoA monooxygenase
MPTPRLDKAEKQRSSVMAEVENPPSNIPPLFTPFKLRGMELTNRVVVSPMCMYSSEDGTVGDFQLVHLGARAMGGAGLVISEMTNVHRDGRISPGCAGMYKPEHAEAWKRVVDFVHGETEAKIGVQLAHAGRKGATPRSWERGAGGLGDEAWELVSASAIPFDDGSATPREMSIDEIADMVERFAQGARWAEEAGFDMIEFHMGHGYLLSSFMSPLSNVRKDEYGGDLAGRMKFPLEVFHAVRAVWPDDKPISARISAIDYEDGGNKIEDGIAMAQMLFDAGVDIVDVSSGAVTGQGRPKAVGLYQTPFAEAIREATGKPAMTVGNIRSAEDANNIIRDGRADLCAMAKWQLYDPFFTHHAAVELGHEMAWPKQYIQVERMLKG